MSGPDVTVVICVYNGAETLAGCLTALQSQTFPRHRYEIIVVDDGSSDGSGQIAANLGARVLSGPHRGLAAARNLGWRAAASEWVAFTDDDCGPARTWLAFLWQAVQPGGEQVRVLGAAGRIIGFPSALPVPRYIEAAGGFNTDLHLAHPLFPYAPMGNIIYYRQALAAVGGLDERYDAYESCDLHTRLRRKYGGAFLYEPRAVVLHRHHTTWRAFFRQQRWYGRGMAQFMWHYRQETPWSARRELAAWGRVLALGLAALPPSADENALQRRGDFVRQLALRCGFAPTYWSRKERRRW